jgi:hypothetical protein
MHMQITCKPLVHEYRALEFKFSLKGKEARIRKLPPRFDVKVKTIKFVVVDFTITRSIELVVNRRRVVGPNRRI